MVSTVPTEMNATMMQRPTMASLLRLRRRHVSVQRRVGLPEARSCSRATSSSMICASEMELTVMSSVIWLPAVSWPPTYG